MKLVSAYKVRRGEEILFELLKKRDPKESISHREMPTMEEHKRFFNSNPYLHWYLIECDVEISECGKAVASKFVGSIYLSWKLEIGVHLFPEYRDKSYEQQAIQMVMVLHGRPRYFLNVSVNNRDMMNIVEGLGFKHIQNTYEFIYDKR